MNILLTNDDSFDSPLFHILFDTLSEEGHKIDCVMPAAEQSWKSKAMTRFGILKDAEVSVDGRSFRTFEGTPADCINFGLHHVCESRPDLVISGINMGYNVSLSYILSSGTVGAAMESYLEGVPSISISQQLSQELFKHWHGSRSFPPGETGRLKKQFKEVFGAFSDHMQKLLDSNELWALELPCELRKDWQIIETKPSLAHYGSAFIQHEDGTWSHCSPRLGIDSDPASDLNIMQSGHAALNKLDFKSLC